MRTQYLSTQLIDGHKEYLINHPLFTANISELGGQLTSFVDKNNDQWIWLSDSAVRDGSKAIRGGVPLCWPWFGPYKGASMPQLSMPQPSLPQHGYARLAPWKLITIDENEEQVSVRFQADFSNLDISPEQHLETGIQALLSCTLFIEYQFSDSLVINLHTENSSNIAIKMTQAIHTYFNLPTVSELAVQGLCNVEYYDQLLSQNFVSDTPLDIDRALDRIYNKGSSGKHKNIDTDDNQVKIVNKQSNEALFTISGNNHDSVVIWNPWQEGAKGLADFEDRGYLNMLCVEMANTRPITLNPHSSYTLTQSITR